MGSTWKEGIVRLEVDKTTFVASLMIGNCCQGSGPIFSRLIPFVLLSGLTKIVRFKTNTKNMVCVCLCVCLFLLVVVSLGISKKNLDV